MTTADDRARGLAAFAREDWAEAFARLTGADRLEPLGADDLDRLATAAYLVGEEAASADARTRAHTLHLAEGEMERAAMSGFWLVLAALENPGQEAVARGWLARLKRLLDECPPDCAARGRWLCASGYACVVAGDTAAAEPAFAEAVRVGGKSGDHDVMALARQGYGRVLLRRGRTADGLAALDEAMVAVTCGEVGPIIAGVVYCSVIGACHEVFDLHRAHQWTESLAGWCAAHPDMVPFHGPCLVRRSELLLLQGSWNESLDEARRACARTSQGAARRDAGLALYQLGELHRLRGEFGQAEAAYRQANAAGRQPDPGLALLRLAQGEMAAAVTAVRRALEEARSPRIRFDVRRAFVVIMLATADFTAAGSAADDLEQSAREIAAPFMVAAAADARGRVQLATGEADLALASLRSAAARWREIEAPYELARTRTAIALAYLQRRDEEGARMELEAAQDVFERLGAAPDAARVAGLLARWSARPAAGLTGREVEVLRLVATGLSNRAIGEQLAISEKTVARHISNIFTKLDLPSRSAATAYAYQHKLL